VSLLKTVVTNPYGAANNFVKRSPQKKVDGLFPREPQFSSLNMAEQILKQTNIMALNHYFALKVYGCLL
jgi:hypothetical protein